MQLNKMTNEQLVELYQNNNHNEIYFNQIYIKNIGLIKSITSVMRELDSAKYTYDDYNQIAMLGLLRAIKNYNPNCNSKFSTFATTVIKQQLYHYTKATKSLKNNMGYEFVPIHSTIKSDGDMQVCETISLDYDYYEVNCDRLIQNEQIEFVKLFRTTLSNKENAILDGLMEGKSQREVGDYLGMTRQNVNLIVNKIQKKFKELNYE